jgi:hypothetical protein
MAADHTSGLVSWKAEAHSFSFCCLGQFGVNYSSIHTPYGRNWRYYHFGLGPPDVISSVIASRDEHPATQSISSSNSFGRSEATVSWFCFFFESLQASSTYLENQILASQTIIAAFPVWSLRAYQPSPTSPP